MNRYTLEVVVNEGSDEWWEQITDNSTGIDEVLHWIKTILSDSHVDAQVTLKKYES